MLFQEPSDLHFHPSYPFVSRELMELNPVQSRLLDFLLEGNHLGAYEFALEQIRAGAGMDHLYLKLIEPVMLETGERWAAHQLSVGQEHLISATVQMLMAHLYRHFPIPQQRAGRTLLNSCLAGELHGIGLRMASDLFERKGWTVYHLGTDTPDAVLLEMIRVIRPDIVGLSSALSYSALHFEAIVSRIRSIEMQPHPLIIVGGNTFRYPSERINLIGADLVTTDAAEAIAFALESRSS